MKVADVMNKHVEYVTTDTSVIEVCRHIFGRGVNGLPVCKDKKVVGFITERDILSKLYPSIDEYIDDPFHASDFEEMEEKASEVLSLTAKDVMSTNPATVTSDTPVLQAQSLMFIHKVGRLPVIDKNGELIGIISKGDIFRAIVGKKLPFEEEEEFYDWLAKNYDSVVDWERRLTFEISDLVELFEKENVKNIIDVASGTGEHIIALAKEGFNTAGFEASPLMGKSAESKIQKLPESLKKRVKQFTGLYKDSLPQLRNRPDAAIFMGNVLPHILLTDKDILKNVVRIIRAKQPVLVFQIANFDKIFKIGDGYRDFAIHKVPQALGEKQAFLRFYTQDNGKTTYNIAIFKYDNEQWNFRGIHTKQIIRIGEKEIIEMLKDLGFSKIALYGSSFYGPLFKKPFEPLESDWLNVVAFR